MLSKKERSASGSFSQNTLFELEGKTYCMNMREDLLHGYNAAKSSVIQPARKATPPKGVTAPHLRTPVMLRV